MKIEEKKYAIYDYSARWNQKDFQNNSCSVRMVYREEPTEEELERDLTIWKNQC